MYILSSIVGTGDSKFLVNPWLCAVESFNMGWAVDTRGDPTQVTEVWAPSAAGSPELFARPVARWGAAGDEKHVRGEGLPL